VEAGPRGRVRVAARGRLCAEGVGRRRSAGLGLGGGGGVEAGDAQRGGGEDLAAEGRGPTQIEEGLLRDDGAGWGSAVGVL
jgi:hypothetical protein